MSFLSRLFGGGSTEPPAYTPDDADPIGAFWRWWSSAAAPLDRAIRKKRLDPWIDPLADAVRAIDPGLAWELGPGERCHHHLAVSSEGDAELRLVTQRWFAAAPPADLTWEFHPARQGRPWRHASIAFGEVRFDFDAFRFALDVDETRAVVHIEAFHPRFADVDDKGLLRGLFVALDHMLGEDRVSKFVGSIDVAVELPQDGLEPDQLVAAVDHVEGLGPDGWCSGEGEVDGKRLVFVAAQRLKRLDHLGHDVLVTLRIPYLRPQPDGMPGEGELEAIGEVVDEVLEPFDPGCLYLGYASLDGKRLVHLRFAPSAPGLNALADWAASETRWEVELETALDPRWDTHPPWIA